MNNALHSCALVGKLCAVDLIDCLVSGSFTTHFFSSCIGSTLTSVAPSSQVRVTNEVPNVTATLTHGDRAATVGGG